MANYHHVKNQRSEKWVKFIPKLIGPLNKGKSRKNGQNALRIKALKVGWYHPVGGEIHPVESAKTSALMGKSVHHAINTRVVPPIRTIFDPLKCPQYNLGVMEITIAYIQIKSIGEMASSNNVMVLEISIMTSVY